MISIETAVSYVKQQEAAWEGFTATQILGVGVESGERLIVTNNARWVVWNGENGVYGEC